MTTPCPTCSLTDAERTQLIAHLRARFVADDMNDVELDRRCASELEAGCTCPRKEDKHDR